MILKNLVVKNGSYQKGGETKHRYLTVGQLHDGKHGQYITLDAHINLAALPRNEGETRVMVSLYDPKEQSKPRERSEPRQEFEDEIPF